MGHHLTISETADQLAVSTSTVRREIAAGRMPVIRIASRMRIDSGDLADYIRERREQQGAIMGTTGTGRMSATDPHCRACNHLLPLHGRRRGPCRSRNCKCPGWDPVLPLLADQRTVASSAVTTTLADSTSEAVIMSLRVPSGYNSRVTISLALTGK